MFYTSECRRAVWWAMRAISEGCAPHMQTALSALSWTVRVTSWAIRTFLSHWGNSAYWRQWELLSESLHGLQLLTWWTTRAQVPVGTPTSFCALLLPAGCRSVSFTLWTLGMFIVDPAASQHIACHHKEQSALTVSCVTRRTFMAVCVYTKHLAGPSQ